MARNEDRHVDHSLAAQMKGRACHGPCTVLGRGYVVRETKAVPPQSLHSNVGTMKDPECHAGQ